MVRIFDDLVCCMAFVDNANTKAIFDDDFVTESVLKMCDMAKFSFHLNDVASFVDMGVKVNEGDVVQLYMYDNSNCYISESFDDFARDYKMIMNEIKKQER